jgi:hypothetical protein
MTVQDKRWIRRMMHKTEFLDCFSSGAKALRAAIQIKKLSNSLKKTKKLRPTRGNVLPLRNAMAEHGQELTPQECKDAVLVINKIIGLNIG